MLAGFLLVGAGKGMGVGCGIRDMNLEFSNYEPGTEKETIQFRVSDLSDR